MDGFNLIPSFFFFFDPISTWLIVVLTKQREDVEGSVVPRFRRKTEVEIIADDVASETESLLANNPAGPG